VIAVLEAIRERVRRGSGLKFGLFELTESPPVQPASIQEREILEQVNEAASASPAIERSQIRTTTFLAEDLAIRELQLEFGISINRQVALDPNARVDGIFVKHGRGYLVEVKYLQRAIPDHLIRDAADQLRRQKWRHGSDDVTMILVVVIDNESIDVDNERSRAQTIAAATERNLLIRVYSYAELSHKYGFEGN
jgi:hypothetical protein